MRRAGALYLLPLLAMTAIGCGSGARPPRLASASPPSSPGPQPPTFASASQASGTSARLQAISAVDGSVVWASGVEGSVLRSEDGGAHWIALQVPDAADLQFRDIHAFDAQHAFLLSAGDGPLSRIYVTSDGGTTWTLQFTSPDPKGFLDCFDFWDRRRGVAYGDSVDGQLYVLRTLDGGATWLRVPAQGLPTAGAGEGGFAASGGCVRAGAGGKAWIGTGAGGHARVLRSDDWGVTWDASEVPVARGKTAGIMSVVPSGDELLALGGDLGDPDAVTSDRVAASRDGGRTWHRRASPGFGGAVYGAAASGPSAIVAVGPKGIAISQDQGTTWTALSDGDFWSVAFGSAERFWAVGPGGAIVRFDATSK